MKTVVLAIAIVFAAAYTASADMIPTLNSVTSVGGGAWQFNYTWTLAEDSRIDAAGTGNPATVTIYDFGGYNGMHAEPVGWTFSSADTGVTPPNLIVADDPGTPNLTWTWTGGSTLTGPLNLGTFWAQTTLGSGIRFDDYAAQSTKNSGPTAGTPTQNRGLAAVPVAVPEPASMLLIGTGLVGISLVQRKFRKR